MARSFFDLFGPVDVEECMTHFYEDDHGRHWWHCLTCDDGSNKHGRHHRGHKRQDDAAMGARMHRQDKLSVRRDRAYRALWWAEIAETASLARFIDLWESMYGTWRPTVPGDPRSELECMQAVREMTRKINEDRRK